MTGRHEPGRPRRRGDDPGADGWRGRHGPPGAFWWRRRFLRIALVVSVIWIGFGVLFGVFAGGGDRGRDGPPGSPPVIVA
ncbi:MAG: hypothetical protein WKF64_06930, partial [Ilumatobacteraceae bacterium]